MVHNDSSATLSATVNGSKANIHEARGCISAHDLDNLHICVGAINDEYIVYIYLLGATHVKKTTFLAQK